jgi:hypothetical protein
MNIFKSFKNPIFIIDEWHNISKNDVIYSDENSIYGIGIPLKIKYLKGFKSEVMQSILDNASMSS